MVSYQDNNLELISFSLLIVIVWRSCVLITSEDQSVESINVLILFALTGFQALKELGVEIEVFYASEIDEQAIQVGKNDLYITSYFA